jgi:hypothetical protein
MAKTVSYFIPTGIALLVVIVLVAIVLGFVYPGSFELFTSQSVDSVPPVNSDSQPSFARPEGSNEVFAESDEPQRKPCDSNKPYGPEATPAPCFPAD